MAIERLCDPEAEVSAHYVIAKTGEITQLVPEVMRAWHAGAGEWAGRGDVNSRSIGIELDNDGASPFPEPQMQALETLLQDVMSRRAIAPDGVIGHSDMALGRKVDPGTRFDWQRLERQGLARQRGTDRGPVDVGPSAFRTLAQSVGYTADAPDHVLLQAVRLRYRSGATGPLCAADFTPLGRAAV